MNYFVDLDGTLKTDRDFIGGETITIGDYSYPYLIRPQAKEFVEELSKKGDVFICTAASVRYAKKFVNIIGIEKYIKDIFGRDNMRNVPSRYLSNFLLFDNDHQLAEEKIFAMERGHMLFNKKRIIDVKTFMGNDDNELLNLLKNI